MFKNIDDNLSNIEQMQLKDVIFASQKQNLCWNVIFNTLTVNKIDYVGYFQYVHYEIEYPAESKLKRELAIPKKSDNTDVQMFPPQVNVWLISVLEKTEWAIKNGQFRENWMGNQEWTVQRHRQCWAQGTGWKQTQKNTKN